MNQPDASSQSTESTCAEVLVMLSITPEHLRKSLNDRRNKAQETRRALLNIAAQLKDEIAAIEQLLAELTI